MCGGHAPLPVKLDGKRFPFTEWQRTLSRDAHSGNVDPLFVDVTGKKRPAGEGPDIGAYER